MEKEKLLLIKCRGAIEAALGWGDSATWNNDDFEQLSQQIFAKTKVRLSVSTLKRIWGKVRYDNFPTSATLNALAGFLDYESWRHFRMKNEAVDRAGAVGNQEIANDLSGSGELKSQAKLFFQKIIVNGMPAAVVLFVLAAFIIAKTGSKKADFSKLRFESVKVSDTLPNSVIFNYNASALSSDSVYIQQSWDPARREKVAWDGQQHTAIYYNPGYFIAKLIVNNEIKKECVVSIKTRGWKGIIETKPTPIYLSAKEIKGKGFMGISDSLLRQKSRSPVFNGLWVKFANVQEFKGIDAGNFSIEATFRNTSAVEASICRQAKMIVLGAGSAIVIPLSEKGCISDLELITCDGYVSGKEHDMTPFGCDFSQFQHLMCSVANGRLKIFLNGTPIFETAQKYTLGKIEGIRFEFEGAGQVKDVKLSTAGAGAYEDNF